MLNSIGTKRQKVLAWVSKIKFESHHEQTKNLRFEGTGEWLFEKKSFHRWVETDSSSIMWLAGNGMRSLDAQSWPPADKCLFSWIRENCPEVRLAISVDRCVSNSWCSSLVVQTLTDTYATVPTIYFYCYFGEKERQETVSISNSLLKQLSARCDKLDPHILSAFHNDSSLTAESSESLLVAALGRFQKVFVVVDALDECSLQERKSMIQMFKRLIKSGSSVKVFLTSRPERDIGRLLQGTLHHYIDVQDTLKDITPFVAATVEDCISDGSLLDGVVSTSLKAHLIQTLNGEANGM